MQMWVQLAEAVKKRGGVVSAPPSFLLGVPGMGDDLEVRVLLEPGCRDQREAQGADREGGAEGSVERTRESTNRNRIGGAADRGERANDREAPATEGKRRRSGDCAGKVIVITRGDLASRLKGRRGQEATEREVSRGHSSRAAAAGDGEVKGRTERRA